MEPSVSQSLDKESTEEYLTEKNIHGLLKWLCTEIVKHRPQDPLSFVSNLCTQTAMAYQSGYSLTMLDELLQQSKEQSIEDCRMSKPSLMLTIAEKQAKKEQLSGVVREINAHVTSVRDTSTAVLSGLITVLHCDNAIMFSVDPTITPYLCIDSELSEQPCKSEMISEEELAELHKAYESKEMTKTTSESNVKSWIIPIIDEEGSSVIAMIKLMKSSDESSKEIDDDYESIVLSELSTQIWTALNNAHLYELSVKPSEKNQALIALWNTLNDSMISLNSMLFTARIKSAQLCNAKNSDFYLVDSTTHKMWILQGDSNVLFDLDQSSDAAEPSSEDGSLNGGILLNERVRHAKQCAVTAKVVRESDQISVPMLIDDDQTSRQVCGVLQVYGRSSKDSVFLFSDPDTETVEFLTIIVSLLTPLFQKRFLPLRAMFMSRESEDSMPSDDLSQSASMRHHHLQSSDMFSIAESPPLNHLSDDNEEHQG